MKRAALFLLATITASVFFIPMAFAATNTLQVLRYTDITVNRRNAYDFESEQVAPMSTARNRLMSLLIENDVPLQNTFTVEPGFIVLSLTENEGTYRTYATASYTGEFDLTDEMIVENKQAADLVSAQADAEIEGIDADTDRLLQSQAVRDDPTLGQRLTTTKAALVQCINSHKATWPTDCGDEYDAYDLAVDRITDTIVDTSSADVKIATITETRDRLLATPTATEHPALAEQLRTTATDAITCITANRTNWSATCRAQIGAFDAAVRAFQTQATTDHPEVPLPPAVISDGCKDGDILCSRINLLIGPNDPRRSEYISRVRAGGFEVLFLSILTGLLSVTAAIAVLGLMYGAYLYITAHGDEDKLGKAKQFITLTLTGLVLIILAYAIIVGIRDIFYAPI